MAIAIENSGFNSSTDGADSDSFAYTCTGSDLTLVAIIGWRDTSTSGAPTVSSCTYNSVALTYRARASVNYGSDDYVVCEIWTLDDPATGSNTMAYSLSEAATREIGCTLISLTDASNGVGSSVGQSTGDGTDIDTTFTTDVSGSIIIGGIFQHAVSGPSFSEDSGTNETQENVPNTYYCHWGGNKTATGGSDEIGVTSDQSSDWAMAAVEIKAAAAAAAAPTGHIEGPLYGPLGGPI